MSDQPKVAGPYALPTEYDDLLPVSLHKSKKGEYYLLDRHNDSVAIFEPSLEIEDMERIVALINK